MIKISITNAKLGDKIPSLNLPTTICRADAPCKKGCYAKKGNWLFPNVQNSLNNNLISYFSTLVVRTAIFLFLYFNRI